jgi:NAD(P)-dependent dehydrogenase (short-subunit alcohol dehydrogenase family)
MSSYRPHQRFGDRHQRRWRLGAATVRRLAQTGAKVMIADVSDERGESRPLDYLGLTALDLAAFSLARIPAPQTAIET